MTLVQQLLAGEIVAMTPENKVALEILCDLALVARTDLGAYIWAGPPNPRSAVCAFSLWCKASFKVDVHDLAIAFCNANQLPGVSMGWLGEWQVPKMNRKQIGVANAKAIRAERKAHESDGGRAERN